MIPYENIDSIPPFQRVLILLVILLGIISGFFYFVYSPRSAEIGRMKEETVRIREELARNREIVKQLPEFEKDVRLLEEYLALAVEQLPKGKEIPELLTQISNSGRRSGLDFSLFSPLQEVKKDFYAEVPVKIKVTGHFHNVARFFEEVSKLPRIVNIMDFSLAGNEDETGVVTTECQINTFRFLEESERVKDTTKIESKGKK